MATNPVVIFLDPISGEFGYGAIDVRISRTAANIITIDNNDDATPAPTLIIDTINRRLGHVISGTLTPSFDYHYQKQAANGDYVFDIYSDNGGENFEFQGRRARGTIAVPAALADDDDMWEFGAYGHNGTSFTGQCAAILFEAAGTFTLTSQGTRQVYKTTENGTTTLSEVLVLGDDGCVIISGQTNGLIGAVAGEYLRIVGATRGEGTIGVFANSTDTQPQSQLLDGSILFGVGGVTAPDARIRRTGVSIITIDNNSTGACTIVPAADSQNNLGTSALRWSTIVANTYDVYAAASDANPTTRVQTGAVLLGAGGASALDSRIRRAGTSLMIMDNNGTNRTWLVDASNRRVGFTTVDDTFTPSFMSHYEHQTTDLNIVYDNYGNNLNLIGRRSGGSKAAPTDVGTGLDLFLWGARGWEGGAFSGDQATLEMETSQAWSVGAHGTRFAVRVTANGSTTLTERLRVDNDGSVEANVSMGIMNALGDANFNAALSNQALTMGAGGGSAVDSRIRRTAASTFTIDDGSTGGATVVPATTNTGVLGTNSLKWNRVRATSVVTGDLELCDEERNAHWVFREETDRIVVTNKITGKKYLLNLKEIT
jgi:hypothetical protein